MHILPSTPNGHQAHPPQSVRDWAGLYRQRGFAVARLRPGDKRPSQAGWSTRSAELDEFLPEEGVGLLGGWLSDGGRPGHASIVVDLDSADAGARADEYLPPTAMVEGRTGKPNSHRYYLTPIATIPYSAVSTADDAAAAAGRHPGPVKKSFRNGKKNKAIMDFIGTGGVAVAPPSMHPLGEIRAWVGGTPGEPAVVAFAELWDAVCALATACGWRDRGRAGRRPPTRRATTANLAPAKAGPVAAARLDPAARYLRTIPDDDLSRSGRGGHDTLFRHVCAVVRKFGVTDPDALSELFETHYNDRLRRLDVSRPGESFEPWTADELDHKIRDALAASPPDGTGPGGLLPAGDGPDPRPRDWNNSHRLAEGFGRAHIVRFVKDSAYLYGGTHYAVVSNDTLTGLMWEHAEAEAGREYDRQRGRWEAEAGPRFAAVQQTLDGVRIAAPDPGSAGGDLLAASRHLAEQAARLDRHRPRGVPNVTRGLVANAVGAARARCQLDEATPLDTWLTPDKRLSEADPRGNWLAVANGLLKLDTRALVHHTPYWFSTVALPVAYDPDAPPPPRWLRLLAEVMEGDAGRIGVLQEITGACLDRSLTLAWFAVLVGEGANGKSVFLAVLRGLLGEDNCAAVDLGQLAGDGNRFAAFNLYGKLANISADQSYFEGTDESALKRLTGGNDLVTFEQKGRQPIAAVNRCKIIFACNAMPTFKDRTGGLWRRLVPVPFTWQVPVGRRGPSLLRPETWAGELPGILNWALEGLARLRARGEFELPPACRALLDQHRSDSNPARAFLQEYYRATGDPADFVVSSELYKSYSTWCADNGFSHPLNAVAFGREVARVFGAAVTSESRRSTFGPGKVRGRVGLRPTEWGDRPKTRGGADGADRGGSAGASVPAPAPPQPPADQPLR